MFKKLKQSIIRSSFFSVSASVISYLAIILIARSYPQESVAEYLYAVTLSLALTLTFDCAAEQSLLHYSKSRSCSIEQLWKKLIPIKLIIISLFLCITFIWEIYSESDFPQFVVFMIVPVFYMGPVFESRGLNIEYARILFFEKLAMLAAIYLISMVTTEILFIVYAYFAISLISCVVQHSVLDLAQSCTVGEVEFNFSNYIKTYTPVYFVLLSQLVYGNLSRLIIDFKLGPILFAYVTFALQIVNAISMVQSQVDRHVRPLIIDLIHDGNRAELITTIKRYTTYYLLPILFLCVFLSAFAKNIIVFLYGEKWNGAGLALQFSSPLVLTIACMRFIDILVVPLNARRINLTVNFTAAASLFALLWLNPWKNIESCIILIVLCQGLHVLFMCGYLCMKLEKHI